LALAAQGSRYPSDWSRINAVWQLFVFETFNFSYLLSFVILMRKTFRKEA